MNNRKLSIIFVSTYVPRLCGIATFTNDLYKAISKELKLNYSFLDEISVKIVAIDNMKGDLDYPSEVVYVIKEQFLEDYIRAAEFVNLSKTDLVIVQHEFGIFGGKFGDFILSFLRNLKTPVFTTLHSILKNPLKEQKIIIKQLAEYSYKLIVMTNKAKEFLTADPYDILPDKISIIPHGIPDVPFIDPFYYKKELSLENKHVILTFGLISPSKGLEFMIEAMSIIVSTHPDTVYVILGKTHPEVYLRNGEEYRNLLKKRIKLLQIEDNILFIDEYVDLELLTKYLNTSDIYVTPYPSKEQICSGTLSYALGTGNAVISTPYYHAEELLADNRGILVPFNNAETLAEAIITLLSDENNRNELRRNAYLYCRNMTWNNIGSNLLKEFQTYMDEKYQNNLIKDSLLPKKLLRPEYTSLPSIDISHLITMTDDVGLTQHSYYSIPNRNFGYSLCDNARALIFIMKYRYEFKIYNDPTIEKLKQTYLSFIIHSYNSESKLFRNFMGYNRQWLEEKGSQDTNGRAIWSLGVAINLIEDLSLRDGLTRLFKKTISSQNAFHHPRALSYILMGLLEYLNVFPGDLDIKLLQKTISKRIYDLFLDNMSSDWKWFEEKLFHTNALIANSLLSSGYNLQNEEYQNLALEVLEWLVNQQISDKGYLTIIGNKGWMDKFGNRANFDQQPIEAYTILEACLNAYKITNNETWLGKVYMCFDWFLGKNDCNLPLYDPITKGCYDGLEPSDINQNIGAESTLAWLLSLFNLHELTQKEIYILDE